MKHAMLVLISVLIGGLIAFQGVINARLARVLHEPLQAALISFLVGAMAIALYIVVTGHSFPSPAAVTAVPPWLFIGGTFGAIFITLVIFLLPKIGAATLMAASVTGQMILAVTVDHFGILDLAVRPFSLARMAGIVMLTVGVVLIQRY